MRRTLGSGSGADVTLRDRSVAEYHSEIIFDAERKCFEIRDMLTTTGTFVLLDRPLEMALSKPVCFLKVGSSLISFKVQRKNSNPMMSLFRRLKG